MRAINRNYAQDRTLSTRGNQRKALSRNAMQRCQQTQNHSNTSSSNDECLHGVTEIVFPHAESGQTLLLPSLASLSHSTQNRWLTWVNPPKSINKETLEKFGFSLHKVRFVYPKKSQCLNALLEKALNQGNSHTVVCNLPNQTQVKHQKLESCAKTGQCQGIILKNR